MSKKDELTEKLKSMLLFLAIAKDGINPNNEFVRRYGLCLTEEEFHYYFDDYIDEIHKVADELRSLSNEDGKEVSES